MDASPKFADAAAPVDSASAYSYTSGDGADSGAATSPLNSYSDVDWSATASKRSAAGSASDGSSARDAPSRSSNGSSRRKSRAADAADDDDDDDGTLSPPMSDYGANVAAAAASSSSGNAAAQAERAEHVPPMRGKPAHEIAQALQAANAALQARLRPLRDRCARPPMEGVAVSEFEQVLCAQVSETLADLQADAEMLQLLGDSVLAMTRQLADLTEYTQRLGGMVQHTTKLVADKRAGAA